MKITRRKFLQAAAAGAATIGLSQTQLMQLSEKVLAGDALSYEVLWLHGQNCSGCTTSFAGLEWDGEPDGLTAYADLADGLGKVPTLTGSGVESDGMTTIDDVLLDVLDVKYLSTIMATAGEAADDVIRSRMGGGGTWASGGGVRARVLILEGSIPNLDGRYCEISDRASGGAALDIGTAIDGLKDDADLMISVGNCAAYGGIPAAKSERRSLAATTKSETDAQGLSDYTGGSYDGKIVNVPGCPIHPDWLLGTVARFALGVALNVDTYGRPAAYFGSTNHGGRCPGYQAYCDGQFADFPGQSPDEGGRVYTLDMPSCASDISKLNTAYDIPLCLNALGCRGYSTGADCAFGGPSSTSNGRGWNARGRDGSGDPLISNSCINNGYPCMGCTEKGYPNKFMPFFNYE